MIVLYRRHVLLWWGPCSSPVSSTLWAAAARTIACILAALAYRQYKRPSDCVLRREYWGKRQATDEAFCASEDGDPWFRTGDTAALRGDPERYVILGRTSVDVLKVKHGLHGTICDGPRLTRRRSGVSRCHTAPHA